MRLIFSFDIFLLTAVLARGWPVSSPSPSANSVARHHGWRAVSQAICAAEARAQEPTCVPTGDARASSRGVEQVASVWLTCA